MEGVTFGVAKRDFSERAQKPWEVGFKKGDVLKLIDCEQKNWWKVEVNGRQGYVPAKHVSVAKSKVTKTQNEQSSMDQAVNKFNTKVEENTSKRTREEDPTSQTDEPSQAGSVEKRKSAQTEVSAAKRLKTGVKEHPRLDVPMAIPQDRAQNKAKVTKKAKTKRHKKGDLIPGSSDIVKSVGVNKVPVFPYEDIFKIEKVELPDEESASASSESIPVQATTNSVSSLQSIPASVVSSEPLITQRVSTEEQTALPTIKHEPVACSELGSSSETQNLDNYSNLCCVLFSQVWEILWSMYDPDSLKDPLKIPPKTTFNVRLVCQQWHTGVNKFYEKLNTNLVASFDESSQAPVNFQCSPASFSQQRKYNCIPKYIPDNRNFYEFCSSSQIQQFLSHFQKTHAVLAPLQVQRRRNRNPFLGRFVSINCADFTSRFEALDLARWFTDLLDKFGDHIWYFTVTLNERIAPLRWYLAFVIEWLKLMPNLRHFSWTNVWTEDHDDDDDGQSVKQFSNCYIPRFESVEQSIIALVENSDRLEKFEVKSLEKLQLGGLTAPIVETFLTRNNHIVKLSLETFATLSICPVSLPNLRELNITIHSLHVLKQLEDLEQEWQLERIHLCVKRLRCVSWSRVCRLLERWKTTLNHVTVEFPPSCRKALRDLSLHLDTPNVTHLKLIFTQLPLDTKTSLDFIFPMRTSLEWLEVEYCSSSDYLSYQSDKLNQDRVNYSECSWVLPSNKQLPLISDYRSKIWNEFPNLKGIFNRRFCMWVNNKPTPVTDSFSRQKWLTYIHADKDVVKPEGA